MGASPSSPALLPRCLVCSTATEDEAMLDGDVRHDSWSTNPLPLSFLHYNGRLPDPTAYYLILATMERYLSSDQRQLPSFALRCPLSTKSLIPTIPTVPELSESPDASVFGGRGSGRKPSWRVCCGWQPAYLS